MDRYVEKKHIKNKNKIPLCFDYEMREFYIDRAAEKKTFAFWQQQKKVPLEIIQLKKCFHSD